MAVPARHSVLHRVGVLGLVRRAGMHLVSIGLGTLCVAGGAIAHFTGRSARGEGALGLAALGFLLTGMFLTRS